MIRKLRIKFISITMSLICLVLLAVFSVIAYSNYRQLVQESIQIMERQLRQGDQPLQFRPQIGKPHEPMRMIPIVSVFVDDELNIISEDFENATISKETLEIAVREAMATSGNNGILRAQKLRFMKAAISTGGTHIVFADRSVEITSIQSLILTLTLIFFCTSAVFFIICILLSKWALKPVETAWIKQKQFIADASHELKTPLTVILANLGILDAHKQETIASQHQWLDNTHSEAQRMKKLVEDLLFLAKSDALEIPMVKTHFDLSEALWSVLLPFETYAFELGLNINENIDENLIYNGDAEQLKQLAAILLDNGCKYAAKGSTITVTLSKTADKIILSVHNIGTYIEPQDLEHIFDRFYRTDKSRSHQNASYGLGLAIAKSITENHHGKISVKSSMIEGTTFIAQLPLS